MSKFVPFPNYAGDQDSLVVTRKDFSGGINNRNHPSKIAENQAEELTNWDISIQGQVQKPKGSVQVGDDIGNDSVVGIANYDRTGYTSQLMFYEDQGLWANESEGASNTSVKSNFTAATEVGILQCKESGLTPDDIIIVQNGVDHAFRFQKDSGGTWNSQDLGATAGTGSDSPPLSTVMGWYNNRIWVLKDNLLYFSAAYSADYSTAFDTVTDYFRIPIGDERMIAVTRDSGLLIGGRDAIWALAPSITPNPSTDQPQPLVTDRGIVSKKGWKVVGDDLFFFSQDGLRKLSRTLQDKLQMGTSYPDSYLLKSDFENINWAYIDRVSMELFDNKLFISVPTSSTTFDVWVYNLAINSFHKLDGMSPMCMCTHKINGENRLYYGKYGNGVIYRGHYGYTIEGTTVSDGTAFSSTLIGREEDFGDPLREKNGGEIEIEAFSSGSDFSLTISVAKDGQAFSELGTVELQSGTAPTLPVSLPFSLSDAFVVRKKFSLDRLGSFRTLQVKIENTDTNTEDIIVYGYNIITFREEYEND